MSEETTAPQAEASTYKTLLIGCSIVIWILAIFMIVTLNNIKDELKKMNMVVESVQRNTTTSLSAFQVKDADGKVVYSFAAKPVEAMEEGSCPAPVQ